MTLGYGNQKRKPLMAGTTLSSVGTLDPGTVTASANGRGYAILNQNANSHW